MADGSSKKRKRENEGSSKPKKRVTKDAGPEHLSNHKTATISTLLQPASLPPVIGKLSKPHQKQLNSGNNSHIATSPGISIPGDIPFYPYINKDATSSKTSKKTPPIHRDLILHSTSHPSLDYTAKEDRFLGGQPILRHFIGIYDPKTGKLEVAEAKKMVIRGVVRARKAANEAMVERAAAEVSKLHPLDINTDLLTAIEHGRPEDRIRSDVRHKESQESDRI
jgi:DNA-directed RNA polymerase I subunit RPA49